ncbi:MAG: AAA family ATPase [bacterium]
MTSLDLIVIWRRAEAGATVTLLSADASGPAALAWSGLHAFDAAAAADEARALGRAVRRAVTQRRDLDALVGHGRLLFDLLLPPPVRGAIRAGAGTLTVAGDADWPWPLLHDGAGFLGLRHALGELRIGERLPPQSPPPAGDRLLVVADPAADLPAARYEGEALMRALAGGETGCDLRLGRLRRQDFLRLFRGYRLVHFAGHADPPDASGPGGWRLADGRVDAAALGALAGGAVPALVFANACRSLDEAQSVGEALLAAGVRHFIGTTIDLPDLPGADFATRFYRALREGAAVGEALRQTRAAAAEAGDATWAAYRLFGAPGQVYFRPRPAERWAPGVRQAVVLAVRRPIGEAAPDALAEQSARWRAVLRDRVARQGGRLLPGRAAVDRAVFGVPVTYENDALRAARAAEAIAAAAPDATVVIEAGPVVATGVDVVGASAWAAEAACWAAGPGVYALAGLVRRLGAAATWGLAVDGRWPLVALGREKPVDEPPLVGRAAEIAQIEDIAAAVRAERRPAAITVVGAAGIGKSRLIGALERRLVGRFTVVRGAGVPYDEGAPFAAAAGVIRGLAGLADDAPSTLADTKLAALVDRLDADDGGADVLSIDALLAGDGPRLADLRPALAAMLGLAPDPGRAPPDPASLPAALRLLVEAAARESPLVVVIEDVHWLPDVGLAVVEELIRHLDDRPVLVLATARPSLVERAPQWFEAARHTRIELGPLSAREGEAVLRHAMPDADRATLDALLARAEGNPLFLRELALAGEDGGAPPPTVEAVMQARLDRLGAFEREVLRAAAVLGRTFWQQGVERLLDRAEGVEAALRALERRRFVLGQPTSELPGQSQWRFAHALMHEVVYHGVAGRARAAWHGRAALWLSDEVDAGPDRQARIAVHRAAAGDHARAAEAWLLAAGWAAETLAAAEARRAYGEALAEDDAAGGVLSAAARGAAEVALADLDRGAGALDAAAARLTAAIERSATPAERAERLGMLAVIDEARGDIAAARRRVAEARAAVAGGARDGGRGARGPRG